MITRHLKIFHWKRVHGVRQKVRRAGFEPPVVPVLAEAGSMTYMSSNIQVNTHMRQKGLLGTLKRDEKRRRCRSLRGQNSNYSRERLTPTQSPKRRPMSRAPTSFLSSPIGMNLVSSLVISKTPMGLMWMPPPPLPASFCSPPSPLCSGQNPAWKPYATLATGIIVFPSAVMASP